MDASTRKRVTDRAHAACEYCGLPQSAVPAIRFHIEHILARQHGGKAELENLALACPNCNWHKGPNISGLDPDTGRTERLFNPRTQNWSEHFQFAGPEVRALTPSAEQRYASSVSTRPNVAMFEESCLARKGCRIPVLRLADLSSQRQADNTSSRCGGQRDSGIFDGEVLKWSQT